MNERFSIECLSFPSVSQVKSIVVQYNFISFFNTPHLMASSGGRLEFLSETESETEIELVQFFYAPIERR